MITVAGDAACPVDAAASTSPLDLGVFVNLPLDFWEKIKHFFHNIFLQHRSDRVKKQQEKYNSVKEFA